MRVFVRGGSGHIGSALLPELLGAGHQVTALARSDAAADKLTDTGAEVRRGDLDDLDAIARAAGGADGVIHMAYRSRPMPAGDTAGLIAANLKVIEAIGGSLAGPGKPLVVPL